MALTVEKIEELVRRYSRNYSLVLSVSPGLDKLNSIYRQVAIMYEWPELRNTLTSINLSTLSGTGVYSWFIVDGGTSTTTTWAFSYDGGDSTTTSWTYTIDDGSSIPPGEYYSIASVEVENSASSEEYNVLLKAKSEAEWSLTAKDAASVPVYYRRINDGGVNSIELNPAPNYTGGALKITGYLEPTPLLNSSSTTLFLSSIPDYVIARLLASDYLLLSGNTARAKEYEKKALEDLKIMTDKELIPRGENG
jgi:hypothetical protein